MSNLISRILGNVSTRIMLIIFLLLILVTGFFTGYGYFNQLELQEEKQYDKLRAIVSSTAVQLDGDDHLQLFTDHPNKDDINCVDQNRVYYEMHDILAKVQKENDLYSPLYTLVYNADKDVFEYGVRSDNQTYFRHEYVQYAPELLEFYEEGGIVPQHMSENGTWLSAFEPIRNKDGEVVALLEADVEFTMFIESVNKRYTRQALMAFGVILLIALILIPYVRKILREDALQKRMIVQQKNMIEQKNKDITDSINYAKRIQEAILPADSFMNHFFNKNFALYLPKDIVAGDFYWMQELDDKVMIAVADCTGHGVPGAMVSVVCHNALNRAVREFGLSNANLILDKTTELVIEAFEAKDQSIRDGMDITLCVFDKDLKTISYAGAYNSLYVVRNGELLEFKADKQPIGKYADFKPFTEYVVETEPGDKIYMSTDGYPDQFGGEDGKKMKTKNFKKLLIKYAGLNIEEQKLSLKNEFTKWKGDYEQLDDVCVVGIEI